MIGISICNGYISVNDYHQWNDNRPLFGSEPTAGRLPLQLRPLPAKNDLAVSSAITRAKRHDIGQCGADHAGTGILAAVNPAAQYGHYSWTSLTAMTGPDPPHRDCLSCMSKFLHRTEQSRAAHPESFFARRNNYTGGPVYFEVQNICTGQKITLLGATN